MTAHSCRPIEIPEDDWVKTVFGCASDTQKKMLTEAEKKEEWR